MDFNKVKKALKSDFNCTLIIIINYANNKFAKGLETTKNGISYRYFRILEDNNLEEIKDDILLSYLKEMNETKDDNNY